MLDMRKPGNTEDNTGQNTVFPIGLCMLLSAISFSSRLQICLPQAGKVYIENLLDLIYFLYLYRILILTTLL